MLLFLPLFLNNDEGQPAIRALAGVGADRGTTGRALALIDQFAGSADLGMHFHEVFLNPPLRPFNVLRRYDQTTGSAATAFPAARVGADGAGNPGVDEDCVQFTHPVQITLSHHDLVRKGLPHKPLLFLPGFFELLGQEQNRAAISAFFDMREVLGSAIRTYPVPAHHA